MQLKNNVLKLHRNSTQTQNAQRIKDGILTGVGAAVGGAVAGVVLVAIEKSAVWAWNKIKVLRAS